MEEIEGLLRVAERGPLEASELWGDLYLPLKNRIEHAEGDESLVDILGESSVFRGDLQVLLDLEKPRPARLTNALGVAVDPAYVISELDAKIRKLSPELFGRVLVPLSIKNNLFETSYEFEFAEARRGFQDPDFDFAIDWSDDLGTAQEFFASWGRLRDLVEVREAEDVEIHEMYLALLLLSYLYHRRLYEAAGVYSLEQFWTQYSLDRRQGRSTRSLEEATWTVRVRGVAGPEEDPGEWLEPVEVPRPPPPPPEEEEEVEVATIEIGRAETVLKQEVAAIHEYRSLRTEWQADPAGDVAIEELRAAKSALDEAQGEAETRAKGVRAIVRDKKGWRYSEEPELANVVAWHKLLAEAYAVEFMAGFASLNEKNLPPLLGTREDELARLTLRGMK